MFAGAAFTDQADIKVDTEVVNTLVSLGVINGYTDGSFKPNDTVTRAEMAKMIYVLRTGNSDASAYNDDKTTFTDINGHWARGYVKYCQSLGIIAGVSATQFKPDANVTAQEAAKMLLVTLGYNAEKAGLVGINWASKTNALADENGLLEDVNTSFTAACPRQYAAQLIYNAIFANTVVLRDGEYTKYGTNNSKNPTVGQKYMGLEEFTGLFTGDSKIHTGLKDGQIYVGGKIATYTPANGNALVGEMVKVLYKESKDGVPGLDKKDTVYGIYETDDTTVINATLGDIDDNDGAKIKVDGTKYDVNNMSVYVNYVDTNTTYTAATFTNNYKKDSADTVKFVQDENGKVIAAYITHVEFHKVTGVTSSKISIAGIGTLDIDDDMDLDSSVAKNDIVAVTTLYNADPKDDDAFNIIKKADVTTGVKVSAVKKSTQVRIGDSYAKLANYNNKITGSDSNYKNTVDLDSTYDFVMYGKYWVAAKKVSASSQDIALVTKKGSTGIDDQVKVLKADNTENVYTYDDDDNKGADSSYLQIQGRTDTNSADRLYSFSMVGSNKIQLKNGTKTALAQNGGETVSGLTFKAATTAGNVNNVIYNDDNKSLYVDGKSYVAAEDAVAFVYAANKDDNYVYKIDGLKKIKTSDIVSGTTKKIEYVLNDDKEVVAFYIETSNKPGATASNDKYGYVTTDVSSSKVDGTEYREVSVWNGTAVEDIKIETSTTPANLKKGAFVKYAVGADGLVDTADLEVLTTGNIGAVESYNATRGLLTVYDATTYAVDAVDSNKSTTAVSATNTYKLAKDIVIIGVNTADKKSVEGIDAVTKAFDNGTVATNNIVFVLNSDDEVVAIFVDPDNAIINKSGLIPTGTAIVED